MLSWCACLGYSFGALLSRHMYHCNMPAVCLGAGFSCRMAALWRSHCWLHCQRELTLWVLLFTVGLLFFCLMLACGWYARVWVVCCGVGCLEGSFGPMWLLTSPRLAVMLEMTRVTLQAHLNSNMHLS